MIRPTIHMVAAACRDCGDIRLPVRAVTLTVLDGIMWFDCPDCGRRIERPSPVHAEAALLAAGAELVVT